ncbi:MAG: Yqey-like protein [candidate division BRC1 bacterium ADurb.BinA364]|nr:MAG: Yqey-like protein [candidate division BRC1 bacterium ADurb.BinA364]
MSLKLQIEADLKDAMKNREADRLGALRLIRAEILNYEKMGKGAIDDEGVLALLRRMERQRKESIEAYGQGGRADLAAKEELELKVIQSYMPAALSEAELEAAAREAIAETGAATMKDMGRVMGAVSAKAKALGKAVDGAALSAIVKKALGQ